MKTHDFLLELGTEELPPKLLVKLSSSLKNNIINELQQLNISTSNVIAYSTPRRLAITITVPYSGAACAEKTPRKSI